MQRCCAGDRRDGAPSELDSDAWAKQRFDDLLGDQFGDDAWHSVLPSGAPLVLVKGDVIERGMNLSDALRRVHMGEVSRALENGELVPTFVLDDYRTRVDQMFTEREVL